MESVMVFNSNLLNETSTKFLLILFVFRFESISSYVPNY